MTRVRFLTVFLTVFLALLLVSSAAVAQGVYRLTATINSEGPNDGVASGVSYNLGPATETNVNFSVDVYDRVSLVVGHQPDDKNIEDRYQFFFLLPRPEGEGIPDFSGTYQRQLGAVGFQEVGFNVVTPTSNHSVCSGSMVGGFTFSAADVEWVEADRAWIPGLVRVAWSGKCGEANITQGASGTFELERIEPGDGGNEPPDGGGTEPPPPPPPPPPTYVRIVAPPSGVSLGNSGAATVAISTTVHEGYEGPVYLEAFGPPGLDVTFEPQMIPPPGAGTSAMTIEVGEHVLPMRHLVEIRASGPPRPTSIVFPVELLCDPPFVSYAGLPNSTIVGPGGTTTLHIDVVGSAPLRYQWYEGPTGSIWRPIQDATGSSLMVGPVNGTSFYWLRVTNGCGSWDSPTLRVGNSGPRRRPGR